VRLLFSSALLLLLPSAPVVRSQQSPSPQPTPVVSRDPLATNVIQAAITALGGAAPADATATGTITITAGSDTEAGNIQVFARGTTQTLELITTATQTIRSVYSNGLSNDSDHIASKAPYPFELAATSQSALLPLPLLAGISGSPDFGLQYVGMEAFNGTNCHHVRWWNSYASQADLQSLSDFSSHDIWLSVATGLPVAVSYSTRPGRGAVPSTAVQILYSSYISSQGFLFPSRIEKYVNGTFWATLSITSVSVNAGLSDSVFTLNP
jgi:hypothetical protein